MNDHSSWAPKLFFVLGVSVLGLLLYFGLHDFAYYRLPMSERALNPRHEFLRPSGYGGLSFGLASALLMLLNLSYLIRKRLLHIHWLGHLRSWMAFHVATGLTAGALVLLHSAFYPRSALGIMGFAAIGIVVVTGLVGRYIYAHTPRSLEGVELALEDLRRRLEQHRQELEALGVPADFMRQALSPTLAQGSDSGVLAALWGMLVGDRELRRDYAEFRRRLEKTPALQARARTVLPVAMRYFRERQWVARYNEWRSLMGGWRFLHRWLAIVLIIVVFFHVLVAIQMGSLWILHVSR